VAYDTIQYSQIPITPVVYKLAEPRATGTEVTADQAKVEFYYNNGEKQQT